MDKWASELNNFQRKKYKWPIHEEMLNISDHKGNGNQNDIKVLPHSSQNGYYQEYKQQSVRLWRKRNRYTLLMGM
jgi:hypothetical protein